MMTLSAFSVLSSCPRSSELSPAIFSSARMKVPPSSSNTSDTVVLVGMPSELNTSSSTTSVTITARKMQNSSSNENIAGWKMPWRAMSIMPLLSVAPTNTPTEATIRMLRKRDTRAPIAELRKLTASLLTPTHRSKMASMNRKQIRHRYIIVDI